MRNPHLTPKRYSGTELDGLVTAFREIRDDHAEALVRRAARITAGVSVVRVFRPGTNAPLRKALAGIDLRPLTAMRTADQFERWYQQQLDRIGRVIRKTNADNPRVHPGYKWGHGAKVLSLFVRELVLGSRYFPDAVVRRLEPWLYAPIDRIALGHLKSRGLTDCVSAIKQIDSQARFGAIQDALGEAAARVRVPRVWFDDLWLKRG